MAGFIPEAKGSPASTGLYDASKAGEPSPRVKKAFFRTQGESDYNGSYAGPQDLRYACVLALCLVAAELSLSWSHHMMWERRQQGVPAYPGPVHHAHAHAHAPAGGWCWHIGCKTRQLAMIVFSAGVPITSVPHMLTLTVFSQVPSSIGTLQAQPYWLCHSLTLM